MRIGQTSAILRRVRDARNFEKYFRNQWEWHRTKNAALWELNDKIEEKMPVFILKCLVFETKETIKLLSPRKIKDFCLNHPFNHNLRCQRDEVKTCRVDERQKNCLISEFSFHHESFSALRSLVKFMESQMSFPINISAEHTTLQCARWYIADERAYIVGWTKCRQKNTRLLTSVVLENWFMTTDTKCGRC